MTVISIVMTVVIELFVMTFVAIRGISVTVIFVVFPVAIVVLFAVITMPVVVILVSTLALIVVLIPTVVSFIGLLMMLFRKYRTCDYATGKKNE